jgi:hypothetical protein
VLSDVEDASWSTLLAAVCPVGMLPSCALLSQMLRWMCAQLQLLLPLLSSLSALQFQLKRAACTTGSVHGCTQPNGLRLLTE